MTDLGANDECTGDTQFGTFQVLAGNAPDLTNTLGVAGLSVNTGIESAVDYSGEFDLCVFHGEVTLAELTAIDTTITIFNDVVILIPTDCDGDRTTPCAARVVVTVTGVLVSP